jgi:ankyrin repeat protein
VEYFTRNGESLGNADKYGMNALLWSSKMGHLGIVEFLWDKGPEIIDAVD